MALSINSDVTRRDLLDGWRKIVGSFPHHYFYISPTTCHRRPVESLMSTVFGTRFPTVGFLADLICSKTSENRAGSRPELPCLPKKFCKYPGQLLFSQTLQVINSIVVFHKPVDESDSETIRKRKKDQKCHHLKAADGSVRPAWQGLNPVQVSRMGWT